jgi:small subunit ribosomal protein S5
MAENQEQNKIDTASGIARQELGPRRGPGGNRGGFGGRTGGGNKGGGGRGGRAPRREEEKDGFNEAVLDLRRVTRVVAGGKRFRFRATVVIGDGKGKVGVGVAKGADVQQSIQKAKTAAKRKLVSFRIVNGTIPHEVKAKFSAAEVLLRPAKEGHGLMAGGPVRAVMLLSGVKDITAKCLGGTKNKLTNAMAALEALKQFKNSK